MSSTGAAEAFAKALEETGTHLQGEDLVKLYPPLPSSSENKPIELEKCKYFDLFDTDPAEARAAMEKKRKEAELEHGAAFTEEKERLAATGGIACERFMYESFGSIYYKLYSEDLPVFVTPDSILHAWHRSYDAFVVDMEEECLRPALRTILEASLSECEEMTTNFTENQSERVQKAVSDVEKYLAMGLSLLQGKLEDGYENLDVLRSMVLQERLADVKLFSTRRTFDFSLFKPRGHYIKSESLKNYFRAMMWLGIVDLRMDDLHQLLCGVILLHCLRESETLDDVQQFDSLLSALVGSGADSLSMKTFTHFISPESMAKLVDPSVFGDQERQALLQELQQQIVESSPASQIPSAFDSVTEQQEDQSSVSLALLGQRFVWSAFVFSRLVGGQVVHDGVKQPRDIPSAVDIAFTLFGNNEAAQELVNRMEMSPDADEFVLHRDGIPISSNLVALRKNIDEEFAKESTATTVSIEHVSQWDLAASSNEHTNRIIHATTARYCVVRKQSSGMRPMCEFPDGMVDPYPEFLRRMREMALRMKDIEEDAQNLRDFRSRSNFDEFASTLEMLEDIAVLQASGKELNEDQVTFMQSIIERAWKSRRPGHRVLYREYAGPLFSSYEFTTSLGQRLTDEEFEEDLPWIKTPEWALQSFLCRGEYGESSDEDENERE